LEHNFGLVFSIATALLAFVRIAQHKRNMPTLTRILFLLAIIAAIVYGAMFSLANFVKPSTHKITIEIPASKIKQTVIAPPPEPLPPEPLPVQELKPDEQE